MRNKKALMSLNFLVAMIILLLAGATLIYFAFLYSIDLSNAGDIEACRQSIILADATRFATIDNPSSLNCPREDLLIKKKDVVEGGEINQDKAGKILWGALVECWYKFGNGKLDPYSGSGTTGNTYCLICQTIKFDDSLKLWLEDQRQNNPEYSFQKHELLSLQENKLMPGKDITYIDYLEHHPVFALESLAYEEHILKDNSLIVLSSLKVSAQRGGLFGGLKIPFSHAGQDYALYNLLAIVKGGDFQNYDQTGAKRNEIEGDFSPICKFIVN